MVAAVRLLLCNARSRYRLLLVVVYDEVGNTMRQSSTLRRLEYEDYYRQYVVAKQMIPNTMTASGSSEGLGCVMRRHAAQREFNAWGLLGVCLDVTRDAFWIKGGVSKEGVAERGEKKEYVGFFLLQKCFDSSNGKMRLETRKTSGSARRRCSEGPFVVNKKSPSLCFFFLGKLLRLVEEEEKESGVR